MTDLLTTRWTRYGKDRVYVSTQDGRRVGWLDLVDGSRHLEDEAVAEAFLRALGPFLPPPVEAAPPAPPPTASTVAAPVEPTEAEWADLAQHRPGELVRAEAEQQLAEQRSRSRFGSMLSRALDVHTDERAYRVGAKGEEAIGARLEKLRTRGWHVLHSIPVGKGHSDLDHLLIGPGGVYTVNTKNHPMKQVWVGEHVVKVSGHSTRYLPIARYEADRARRLLTTAVGFDVPTKAVLVILTGTVLPQITITQMPEDVLVLDRTDVPGIFRQAPSRLSQGQVSAVHDKARQSTLWR